MKHYALLGEHLGHSYSKAIHEYVFDMQGIEADYELWEVPMEKKDRILELAKEKNLAGFNITIPYKEVLKEGVAWDAAALEIGAINTVDLEDFTAHNTDYSGFLASLEAFDIEVSGKTAVLLGTGGASKAVAAALRGAGIDKITFVSRHPEREEEVSYEEIPEGDLIINCTPVGMYPKENVSPVKKEILKKFSVAIDLIYNPTETIFLSMAKDLGLKTLSGLFMLVSQALKAQEIWLKKKFDKAFPYDVYTYVRRRYE